MTERELGNLSINGSGSSNGGEYNSVSINGKGEINGDISCKSFHCNGLGTVNGNVKSEKVKINGSSKIDGLLYANDLLVEGRASITKDVMINTFTVNGTTSIGGNVKGEEIKVKGKIKINGDCEVETFHSDGQFTVDGLLSAEQIEVVTYGECVAKEIGGKSITVKQKNNFLLDLLKTVKSVKLVADMIEGDHISLENTKAKVVRGNHILIGENCEIDLVEYKDTFQVVGNGYVKENIQH